MKLECVVSKICVIIIKGKNASSNDALMKAKRKVTLKSPLWMETTLQMEVQMCVANIIWQHESWKLLNKRFNYVVKMFEILELLNPLFLHMKLSIPPFVSQWPLSKIYTWCKNCWKEPWHWLHLIIFRKTLSST